jgi:hypothetical protein
LPWRFNLLAILGGYDSWLSTRTCTLDEGLAVLSTDSLVGALDG